MIGRHVVSRGLLLVCLLLLVSRASVADAKTAHLSVKKQGDRQVLHVQFVPVDSHSTNVYVPPPPWAEHLRYHDWRHHEFQPMGLGRPFDPYWHSWLQYRWFGSRWLGGSWNFDTWYAW